MLVGRKYLAEAYAVHTVLGTELEASNLTCECRVCRPIFNLCISSLHYFMYLTYIM